ncbi:MAG: hypothetical protein U0T56_07635 [Ferruginibacter sp.]
MEDLSKHKMDAEYAIKLTKYPAGSNKASEGGHRICSIEPTTSALWNPYTHETAETF